MSDVSPDPPESPAALRAERRLALLAEMAAIGMRMLRRLDQSLSGGVETAEAFARISRAVRLTLALEEKTDRFLTELLAGPQFANNESAPVDDAWEADERSKAAIRARKADAFDLLVAVSESEGESLESTEKLLDALAETIDEAEASARAHEPRRPAIERMCRHLGLDPELSATVGEGWECGYLAARPRFNPWGEPTYRADYKRPAPQLE